MEFKKFKERMQKHIAQMVKDAKCLYEIGIDQDAFWNLYLDSFPAGTNKIYRERREHDCSCCRHFIRDIGNMVVIKDGHIQTIWDFDTGSATYQPVADAMSARLKMYAVSDIFFTKMAKIGTDSNKEMIDGRVHTWEHLYVELPAQFVERSGRSEGDVKGDFRAKKQVFKRSMDELSMDAINTVLELIADGSLYRGEEWKAALLEFKKLKIEYDKLPENQKDNFAWVKAAEVNTTVTKIRNHSIGTLLVNITEDMELDAAVSQWEKIMAPQNYKRPKAIFTQKMLEGAKKTITELGYMDSLPRRYATLDDIAVNNVLFSNKDSAKRITGGDIFAEMAQDVAVNPKKFSGVKEMSADDFVKNVLPTATEVEVLLENKHSANMVSLIAPQNKGAKTMFKWDNAFSWAYAGNMADSDITERVKAAGGRVDGALRFSHSWNYEGMRNASLMDLHVFMPGSNQKVVKNNIGKEIHDNYGNGERVGWNHRNHAGSGGVQDVDYVDEAPVGYIPVENTTFPDIGRLKEGIYTFKIHNWRHRAPTSGGFKAEIAFGGRVYRFEHRAPLQNKEWVTLAKLELKNGEFKILEMADNDTSPIEVWGLKTQQFVPVSVICYSPNYWDEQSGIGHKHYFFMLKDCVNPEVPNGFYNEHLKNELLQHKRVFEALGSKMAVAYCEDQLSGLGFSATKRNDVIVKVKGATERVIKIKF